MNDNPSKFSDESAKSKINENHMEIDNNDSEDLLNPNALVKVPHRFNILFLLYNYDQLGFRKLQSLLKITPGNLDHHLKKLLESGWVEYKIHFSPRPLKILKITQIGKEEFEDEIKSIKKVLRKLK